MTTAYDAIVLAGGSGRRLGGADKPGLLVGDQPLLDRVLAATAAARTTVIVGPTRATARPVTWTREDPPGGGPVAALAAGLKLVTAPWVALVAADLPFLTADVLDVLLTSTQTGGAVAVDEVGRPQWLLGVWRASALRSAMPAQTHGARLGPVLAAVQPRHVVLPPGERPPWFDCDTMADVATARVLA